MNSSDFADWKRHPITQLIFSEIERMIEYGKEELALTAGEDSGTDSKRVGKLIAYRDILDISFDEMKEGTNQDD